MPEGPEVRREADRIAAAIAGRPLAAVEFGLSRLQPFAARLHGCEVTAVSTRGKALLIHFDNGLTLYSHNQLYGRWMVRRRGRLPRTGRSLRAALHTDSHSALLYSASEIAVLDADGIALHPYLARLGPDLLDPTLTGAAVAARLASDPFRRRSLQALLLDQGFVAGVGNYLRSEILFHARLAPDARPVGLSPAELGRLGRSTVIIGRRAYQTGGVTNPPSRVARLAARGIGRSGYRFAVFDRAGGPCYRCGEVIGRRTASSRRLYWCPACQPAP